MGLKDRLLQAKCKVGVHSGEWKQLAAGSCDEQRTCAHCGEVSNRTDHHMSDWAYSADPAAPACTRERRCQRCPHVQQEVKHTMDWQYDYEGRHEQCRMRLDCTRCGLTEGKTLLAHRWDLGVEPRDSGYDYSTRIKVYTCEICLLQVVRKADAFPPRQDARD
jgi:hypothetical protein